MGSTLRVGDVGVPITIRSPVDLTGATVQLQLTRPDATTVTRTCSLDEKGTLVSCVTAASNINQAGSYTADLLVTGPGSESYTMGCGTITVLA